MVAARKKEVSCDSIGSRRRCYAASILLRSRKGNGRGHLWGRHWCGCGSRNCSDDLWVADLACTPAKSSMKTSVIPIEKREPISIVRTEPLDLSADRTMGPRAHRTVSARGHFLRGATLRSKMWHEVGRSAAAGGLRVPASHLSSIGPPPNGSFKLWCCRSRMTSVHSRGSYVSRWRYWIRAWNSGEPATSHSVA